MENETIETILITYLITALVCGVAVGFILGATRKMSGDDRLDKRKS